VKPPSSGPHADKIILRMFDETAPRHANCRSPFSVDKSVNNAVPASNDASFEASLERTA
jgi:hypothetical protein